MCIGTYPKEKLYNLPEIMEEFSSGIRILDNVQQFQLVILQYSGTSIIIPEHLQIKICLKNKDDCIHTNQVTLDCKLHW